MLGLGVIHTLYLLIKGQWWRVQDYFSGVKKEEKSTLEDEQNTILYVLEGVKRARDAIKKKFVSKRGMLKVMSKSKMKKDDESGDEI